MLNKIYLWSGGKVMHEGKYLILNVYFRKKPWNLSIPLSKLENNSKLSIK